MSDFWTKRLGNVQPAAIPATTYHPPTITAPYTVAPTHQINPKAPSSRSTKACPECGSGNYTGSPGDSTKMVRCYDCGYNPRFGQQSGAGGLPAGQSAPAQASRQVSTTNNYQPTNIIGRVG
jgi:hypothetical protein